MRSTSIQESATNPANNARYAGTAQSYPNRPATPANSPAVSSSTTGYCHEIRAPHVRHFPRSNIHDSTGMLSGAASSDPHEGQADGGATIDSFRGTR